MRPQRFRTCIQLLTRKSTMSKMVAVILLIFGWTSNAVLFQLSNWTTMGWRWIFFSLVWRLSPIFRPSRNLKRQPRRQIKEAWKACDCTTHVHSARLREVTLPRHFCRVWDGDRCILRQVVERRHDVARPGWHMRAVHQWRTSGDWDIEIGFVPKLVWCCVFSLVALISVESQTKDEDFWCVYAVPDIPAFRMTLRAVRMWSELFFLVKNLSAWRISKALPHLRWCAGRSVAASILMPWDI